MKIPNLTPVRFVGRAPTFWLSPIFTGCYRNYICFDYLGLVRLTSPYPEHDTYFESYLQEDNGLAGLSLIEHPSDISFIYYLLKNV